MESGIVRVYATRLLVGVYVSTSQSSAGSWYAGRNRHLSGRASLLALL